MLNSTKQKSILNILKKYEIEPEHSYQVKKLALLLFDKTKGELHDFSDREKDLLEAGSLLHDIGYYISAKNHHKNASKLILKENPEGFSQEEIQIIANIARYHRGKPPKKTHKAYESLSISAKEVTRKLSAFCRIADALDRAHLCFIEDIDCIYDSISQILHIILKSSVSDCLIEIEKAKQKKELMEKEFNIKIKLKLK